MNILLLAVKQAIKDGQVDSLPIIIDNMIRIRKHLDFAVKAKEQTQFKKI